MRSIKEKKLNGVAEKKFAEMQRRLAEQHANHRV